MKIASVSLYSHRLAVVNGPYRYSGGELDALTTYLVRIGSDTGHVGWGETCPLGPTYQPAHALGAEAALREMAPHLIGAEALPIPLHATMDRALEGHAYAKAAIDIAVHDLLGKAAGLPVHALLGGARRHRIPSYYAIPPLDADTTARAVVEKQDEGYTALQIKIGGRELQADVEAVRAASQALRPGTSLTADANRSLTTADAVHLSRMLADVPFALEQPCRTLAECNALCGRIHHPVYLDEVTTGVDVVMDALRDGYCDGLGMKRTRVGGLTAMRTIRDMAAARGAMLSVDDGWGGDIIAAACVHMGATVEPRLFRGTWLAAPYIDHHYDTAGGVSIREGWIDVPDGAGLGVTPDETLFGAPLLEL